uniref:SCP domain-containing protein n=1 Tax=Caenorhabditis japonica TaxID=281687 RepID=A0A8R1EQN0_CAEJA
MKILGFILLSLTFDFGQNYVVPYFKSSLHYIGGRNLSQAREYYGQMYGIKNMQPLVRDSKLEREAVQLGKDCIIPTFRDNMRIYLDDNQELALRVNGFLKQRDWSGAVQEVNSYSTVIPNRLDLIVPTQNRVGCGGFLCVHQSFMTEHGNQTVKIQYICLIGPKGTISVSDFELHGSEIL